MDADALLREAFAAAVDAARPSACVPRFLPEPPGGRTVVVGAGKAAAAMALAVDRHWSADLSGVVVTAEGHGLACPRIRVIEATHPLPAGVGENAARQVLRAVAERQADDLVLCLLSGGGSALLPLPAANVTLEQKQSLTRDLLRCGAPIREINCVRRHLSRIKGGRLATACHPARVVTLAISDVPGDSPIDIASGPTVGDPTTCADALAVLDRHGIGVPMDIRTALSKSEFESVKPADPRLASAEYHLIARPQESLEAAARAANRHGVSPLILSDRLEGEAREVAQTQARLVRDAVEGRRPLPAPCLLLSGGETTVTVRGPGRGGRNVEFLLAFGVALGPCPGVYALAADTDGVDGTEPVAGALWRPDTLERAAALGLEPREFLASNDAHSFFAALGDSLITGPTLTNVNDFRAVLVLDRTTGGG